MLVTKRLTLLLSMSLVAVTAAHAQDVSDHPRVVEAVQLIETWLDAERAYEQIPGMSAALVHDQELIWAGATGMADARSPSSSRRSA